MKDKKATKSGKEDMGYLKNIGMGICLISLVNLVLASFFIYRYVRENGLDIKEGVSGRSLILFTYLNRLFASFHALTNIVINADIEYMSS